jgi:hypothetical protein
MQKVVVRASGEIGQEGRPAPFELARDRDARRPDGGLSPLSSTASELPCGSAEGRSIAATDSAE